MVSTLYASKETFFLPNAVRKNEGSWPQMPIASGWRRPRSRRPNAALADANILDIDEWTIPL